LQLLHSPQPLLVDVLHLSHLQSFGQQDEEDDELDDGQQHFSFLHLLQLDELELELDDGQHFTHLQFLGQLDEELELDFLHLFL
jgi:hypothetical protein